MPRFRYVAHTLAGLRITGEEVAVDENALVRALQSRDLFVARLAMTGEELGGELSKRAHSKIRDEDLLHFARELGTLLNSGIPFDHALDLVTDQVRSFQLAKVLIQIREDVNAGVSFHHAIEKHPKSIPFLWGHLIEAGEAVGNIAGVLGHIAKQLEQSIALKRKIISALLYPAILIVVTIIAISVFLLFVIPQFSRVFEVLHTKLPLMTRVIFSISAFAKTFFIPSFVVIFLAAYILKKSTETPTGRRTLDLWLVKAPIISELVRDVVMARICINLAAVLSSGVGLIYGLDVVSRTSGNKIYEEMLEGVMEDVRDGSSMSQALSKRAVFSPLMIQMVIVGEESGQLPEMIQKVANYYEEKVETLVARVSTLFEPVMLIFLGVVVGSIVVALMLPIVTISSSLH